MADLTNVLLELLSEPLAWTTRHAQQGIVMMVTTGWRYPAERD